MVVIWCGYQTIWTGIKLAFGVLMEKSLNTPTKKDQGTFCHTLGRLLEMAPNNQQISGWCVCIYVCIEIWFSNFQRTNSDI
jgi:hypothetical protein